MLKEEDPMIELIREWIIKPLDVSSGLHLSVLEVFGVFDRMIADHVRRPENSDLKRLLPSIKKIFVPVDLTRAAKEVALEPSCSALSYAIVRVFTVGAMRL